MTIVFKSDSEFDTLISNEMVKILGSDGESSAELPAKTASSDNKERDSKLAKLVEELIECVDLLEALDHSMVRDVDNVIEFIEDELLSTKEDKGCK